MTMGDHIDCSFVLSKVLIRILCVCKRDVLWASENSFQCSTLCKAGSCSDQ